MKHQRPDIDKIYLYVEDSLSKTKLKACVHFFYQIFNQMIAL